MTTSVFMIALIGIVITWCMALTFLIYTYLSQKEAPNGMSRYEKLLIAMKKKRKPQRLCGYHLTVQYRHSTLAVVDGKNCEICHRDATKKGKKNV